MANNDEKDVYSHHAADVAPLSTMTAAMFFGSITFATMALATCSWANRDYGTFTLAKSTRAQPLDENSLPSVFALLYHLSILGLILLCSYICEYHPPFPHGDKSYDRDDFFFLIGLLLFASALTIKKNDSRICPQLVGKEGFSNDMVCTTSDVREGDEILNRNQTEEWKGWMQCVFLLYHYYNAEEFYKATLILTTGYVWMTGFGHFSFFNASGDLTVVRLLHMLWRLNFLVIFLCLAQGTSYMLYHVCLLHTYYFLMVFLVVRVRKSVNKSKWGVRVKMAVAATAVFIAWDLDNGLFRSVHQPFVSEMPVSGASSGPMREWYFRSTLDHWSAMLGMVFALNVPVIQIFFHKLEAQPALHYTLGKGAFAVGLIAAFVCWILGPFNMVQVDYDATNAYFGCIPVFTYIFFRNFTPTLRSHRMDLLQQIGKVSLETYLMRHHIWLTSDGKTLLTLIPGWPKVNMLVVTIVFVRTCRRLHRLTMFLRGMLLPSDLRKCYRNVFVMAGAIGFFFTLAYLLRATDCLSLSAVAVVSVVFGSVVYKAVLVSTCARPHKSSPPLTAEPTPSAFTEPRTYRNVGQRRSVSALSLISGMLGLLMLGFMWNGLCVFGASKIEPLPEFCNNFANNGIWVPVVSCNAESRGVAYRGYSVSSYATCASPVYVWGWNQTNAPKRCRFSHRNSKTLGNLLDDRTIAFVGDSITRLIFHATVRAMGVDSGAYDVRAPKHADLTKTVGRTKLCFEWAPYTKDQVARLQDMLARPLIPQGEAGLVRPALVVMGGGAWDRLHNYETDEEVRIHQDTVKTLAEEMRRAHTYGVPIVWVVPTTINTNALLTEEKQNNIREEDMSLIRQAYKNLGVNDAASFVIDGTAFTSGRVNESFDGVHYPLSVYDAAAQILGNAIDWLLQPKVSDESMVFPRPGQMVKPLMGLIMLCMILFVLFCFEGCLAFDTSPRLS